MRFWFDLHKFVEAFQDEGLTEDERIANVLSAFKQLPHLARREVLADLKWAAAHLPDVYTAIAPEALRAEEEVRARVVNRRGAG
jgi:monomeric isocitrate dehydrogenase